MANPLYPQTTKITARMQGEYWSREFWGDEQWKAWKFQYDQCMGFRKTLKGKPTEEQMIAIQNNALNLEWYGFVLFHTPALARYDRCDCALCGKKRSQAVKELK